MRIGLPPTPAKDDLSAREFIAAIWARKALPFSLLDDEMFRAQFGVCIPHRLELSKGCFGPGIKGFQPKIALGGNACTGYQTH